MTGQNNPPIPAGTPPTPSDAMPSIGANPPVTDPLPSPTPTPQPTPQPASTELNLPDLPTVDGGPDSLDAVRKGLSQAGLLPEDPGSPADPKPEDPPSPSVEDPILGGQEDPTPDDDDSDPQDKDWKELKNKHKQAIQAKDDELATLQARVKELEAPQEEANAALIAERDEALEAARIAKQEAEDAKAEAETNKQYADIYNLEESDEYKNEIVTPIVEKLDVLYKYADHYGVPRPFIDSILEEPNIQNRNQMLSDKFDTLAIQQMQPHIEEFQRRMQAKRDADNQPMELRQKLHTERVEREKQTQQRELEQFETVSKNSWDEISKVYSEYEFTKQYFTADDASGISGYANTLYNQVMEGVKVSGGRNLDENLVKVIAAASHKAAAFDTMVKDLQETKAVNAELEQTINGIKTAHPGIKTGQGSETPPPSGDSPVGLPDKNTLLDMLQKSSQESGNGIAIPAQVPVE